MKKIQKIVKNIKILAFRLVVLFFALQYMLKSKSKEKKIGILVGEFFHKELIGFGGYGMTVKNITDYFNTNNNTLSAEVILTSSINNVLPEVRHYHNADVLFPPPIKSNGNYIKNFIKYAKICNSRNYDLLVTIEYYDSYEYALSAVPKTPLLIWIHDPRSETEWKNISTVSLEVLACKKNRAEDLLEFRLDEKKSIERIVKSSRLLNRKIIFATQARCLIERFQKAYDLFDKNIVFLPNPIKIPVVDKATYSSRPLLCLLGRLDPVKRPWIFFELAKRFKGVDFLVAGITHYPDIMNPIIKKYSSLTNLKFLGLVLDDKKEDVLKNVWGVVNTSIHEALPVSFLEVFSFYKPIISCQNPDNLADKFGIYTGELLGDAFDNYTMDIFSDALDRFLSNRNVMIEKGCLSRKYVEEFHSFSNFDSALKEITINNKI